MEEERMGSDGVTEKERPSEAKQNVKQEEEEEDGGPPPGFRPTPPLPPEPLSSPVELAVQKEEQKITCEVGPADEDSLGPPPGYQFPTPTAMAPPPILNVGKSLPFETPQPESVSQLRAQPPAYQFPSSRTMASLPMNDVEKMPLHSPAQVSHLTAPAHPPPETPVQESGTMPPLQRPPQAPAAQPMMPPQSAVHASHPQSRPPLPAPTYEMAQMVCGSCQRLLSYIRGARYVQCSCCQTVNYVLEVTPQQVSPVIERPVVCGFVSEHQVGQVKCSSCSLLLMYPYGAPSVKCSSCYSVTEIGEHNKRPPWSIQQGRAPPPPPPASSTVR